MGDLSKCLPVTLRFEGDWSDNSKDPGGATMNGITLATFRRYRPNASKEDLRNISPEVRQVIYSDGYWKPISGDNLAPGVDLAAFDYGVNSGTGAAKKALSASDSLSPVERVQAICARRLSLLHGLKTWAYFGKGWGARVAQVEAIGIKWASGSSLDAKTNLSLAADSARKKVKQHAAAGTVSGAGVSTSAATSGDPWQIVAAIVLAVLIAGAFGFLAYRHFQRAAALTGAAKGV